MSNEGKNENVNQGQTKYDLDLDAPTEKKTEVEPKTVELTIVKRAREQVTKQQKDVQEILSERLRTSGAFATSSVQGNLAKALGFQSNINRVFKSVGVAFQATQPALQLAQQMTEAHKSIARSMQPMLETMRQLGEKIQKMFEALRQSLPSFSSIFKKISSGITNRIAPFVQTVVSKFASFKPPPITNFLKQCVEQVHRLGQSLYKKFNFGRIFQPIIEWIRILRESNFFLVIYAAKGDELSLVQLGRLWWKIRALYYDYCREQGKKPTQSEFHSYLRARCSEFIMQNEYYHPLIDLPKAVFWYVLARLLVDYAEITESNIEYDDEKDPEKINLGGYRLSIHDDPEHGKSLFTITAANEVNRTQQTIRNWINEGSVKAVQISYPSKLKRFVFPALLLPYTPGLIDQLNAIKKQKDRNRRHQIEGMYTISQLTRIWPISRKTLERWDEKGLLNAQRIDGYRYYTEEQKDKIPFILRDNDSPRFRKLLSAT